MIRIRVPATTANLGPGFDCMGLALDLWNSFEFYPRASGFVVESHGEGEGQLPSDATNLIVTTMLQEIDLLGAERPAGARIVCHNTIPAASGLGSSSTATLAGLLFASAWARHLAGTDPAEIDRAAILERAVEVEGHGDNVAPALLGGFVIVMPDSSGVLTQRIPHVPIKAVVCVPEFAYLTSEARAALPGSYQKADAIFNIGRALLVAEALRTGDDEMLARAMNDRIHEPYRLPAIPGASTARERAIEAGAISVPLSGAGPGLIAFARQGYDRIGRAMNTAFREAGLQSRYWILDATDQGVHIGRLPV
ncbi:homoserine kinase [Fimbriimonas ginsengisoli]|uniref:Homoserine kinase n=1 Tax=Fimbriimonas ginsengisoli Gsoil 348 TaxID=661478 RepID=A0A068NK42_FIMGI|nr:homoserine kinase [Fimbriimonas ginsengisoli]AIE83827.1 homoserine kinase [Fimbriimonas ginsengisoli Gsoil 348]